MELAATTTTFEALSPGYDKLGSVCVGAFIAPVT